MSYFSETLEHYEKIGLERIDKYREELKLLNYSSDELLELAARFQVKADILEEIGDSLAAKNDNLEIALSNNPEIEVKEIITPTMIKMYRSGANNMYLELKAAHVKSCSIGGYKKNEKYAIDRDFIKGCWDEWQLKPSNYKNVTAFASDMLDKQGSYTSLSVIMGLCRQWSKESSC